MPLVYLIDERISNPRSLLASIPEVDLGFLIPATMPIVELLSTVIKGLGGMEGGEKKTQSKNVREATAAPMITGLRIFAHGDSNQVHLGRGIHLRNVVQLTPLASHMRLGASAECLLLGCNVAMDTFRQERFLGGSAIGQRFGSPLYGWTGDELAIKEGSGYRLLHAIARTLGVPTTAGLDTQTLAYDSHFLGATMTVNPYGKATFTGMDTPVAFMLQRD
jgi:hypothetical protein